MESTGEHWSQYSWRPWCGFLFAPTVLAVYVLLPLCNKPVPEVPQLIWVGWLAVLGATTHGRNQVKRIRASGGPVDGALVGAIKAIKG